MAEIPLRIPQVGEGLQEARVVALLKAPGEAVERDEPIYQMETDKAVVDVECPFAGRVVRWLIEPDQMAPIGAEILILETGAPAPAEAGQADQGGAVHYFPLAIPQLGEGLQEARVVAFLKLPGEPVVRDEAIYQIETDKAVMDIECPVDGVLHEWLAKEADLLPIGGVVGRLVVDFPVSEPAPSPEASAQPEPSEADPAPARPERRRDIPPRTRAHALAKGLTEADLALLPVLQRNLTPDDVEAFLASRAAQEKPAPSLRKDCSERPQSPQQRILASRLVRGSKVVVPGMMSVVVNWHGIEEAREDFRTLGGDFKPSAFTLFCFAVAKAAASHPLLRSTLIGEDTVRTYAHLDLGMAVARPNDELVLAVIEDSDALDWLTFARTAKERIALAREGRDQASETVTLSVTNMAGYGIREAVAVVAPPAVATVFLGEPYWGLGGTSIKAPSFIRCANVGMTLDHRLINGVGGAEFLNAVRHNVENIQELIKH